MRFDGAELRMSGRAVTNPVISSSNSERVTFRAVSTERRYDDAAADWIDGDEFATTVVCWGKLGIRVLEILRKGDPVVIDGRMITRRFERNGGTEYMQECKADHVGFDIGRANNRLMRNPRHASETSEAESAPGSAPAENASDSSEVTDPFASAGDDVEQRELADAPF